MQPQCPYCGKYAKRKKMPERRSSFRCKACREQIHVEPNQWLYDAAYLTDEQLGYLEFLACIAQQSTIASNRRGVDLPQIWQVGPCGHAACIQRCSRLQLQPVDDAGLLPARVAGLGDQTVGTSLRSSSKLFQSSGVSSGRSPLNLAY